MLHHSGKSGDQRGTSSREDQLNTVIKLVQPPTYDETKGAQFVVSFTKSRNAYGDEIKDFEVELNNNPTGELTWVWRDLEQSNKDRLYQLALDGVEHVTEAEGTREAAVTVANGEKQAAILKAEGQRQSSILRAEGFSAALENIDGAAKNIDANTLSLQYFDTLKQLGATKATKFVLPMEFTSLLKSFLGN